MPRMERNSHAGFTLIELLVVLVIIGIILSFATLSIHRGDPVAQEVERFIALSELASEEAVLKSTQIGLVFAAGEYAFVTPQEGQWLPIDADPQFRLRRLPEGSRVEVFIDGLSVAYDDAGEGDQPKPQLVFLSSGERTPGEVVFTALDGLTRYRVTLNEFGRAGLRIEGSE